MFSNLAPNLSHVIGLMLAFAALLVFLAIAIAIGFVVVSVVKGKKPALIEAATSLLSSDDVTKDELEVIQDLVKQKRRAQREANIKALMQEVSTGDSIAETPKVRRST